MGFIGQMEHGWLYTGKQTAIVVTSLTDRPSGMAFRMVRRE